MTVETPGSQSALREANQRRVIHAVRAAGALTQAEIARTTGLSQRRSPTSSANFGTSAPSW